MIPRTSRIYGQDAYHYTVRLFWEATLSYRAPRSIGVDCFISFRRGKILAITSSVSDLEILQELKLIIRKESIRSILKTLVHIYQKNVKHLVFFVTVLLSNILPSGVKGTSGLKNLFLLNLIWITFQAKAKVKF